MASDDHAPGFVPGRGYTREDWDEVCDNPPITPEQAAASRPLAETMPELVAAMKRGRGNPRAPTKDLVTLRLDKDVLAAFRASGSGWQSRANEMLRSGLGLDSVKALSMASPHHREDNFNRTIASVEEALNPQVKHTQIERADRPKAG